MLFQPHAARAPTALLPRCSSVSRHEMACQKLWCRRPRGA